MSAAKPLPRELLLSIAARMPPKTRGIWLLMVETGVRVSDAVGAKNGDFDAAGYYHYTAHKTGKHGRAKVSPDFLRKFVDPDHPGELLFPSSAGPKEGERRPFTRQTVYNHIKRAAKMCGYDVEQISTHTARKSFAVETYAEKGLGATMAALQHKDAATTLLYAMSDDPLGAVRKDIADLRDDLSEIYEILDMITGEVFGDELPPLSEKGKKWMKTHKNREKEAETVKK